MTSSPIRIALVDDHDLVREAWRLLLLNNPDFEVVGDWDNGADALDEVGELQPDILLMDINMTPMNGFELAEQMATHHPEIKLIAMSVHNQPRYAIRMLELGVKGYLTKTTSLEEITTGILKVFNGEQYLCHEIRLLMASMN